MNKPKPKDFRIGEPITERERQEVLNKLLNCLVEDERETQYKFAVAEWDHNNVDNR
jgi:hypothetical protein